MIGNCGRVTCKEEGRKARLIGHTDSCKCAATMMRSGREGESRTAEIIYCN